MGLFDGLRSFLTIGEPPPASAALQTRSLEQMVIQVTGYDPALRPWRRATSSEAMGVPAVFKAVSLISNTIGTLNMEVFRNGALLPEADTPMMVVRPDPRYPPHVFWRDSASYKALTGEHWWYVAKRDFDGNAIALVNVDPREIIVERNPRNVLRPIIKWLGEEIPNDDMVQVMYLRDPENPLRGIGPLQACRAAVSVAVEAQEWAANWFAGAPSQTVIKSSVDIDKNEATALKNQWMEGAGNLPKVIDPGIESVTEIGGDPEKAQLSQSRLHQNGEVAMMFSMPPTLLNYAVQGSTITYQNVGQIADDFLRTCLRPHYLEPMEQAMSDLLPRRSIGRFNAASLVLADIKTRFDVYGIGIDKGIFGPEYASQAEGITAGGIENRPVPFAPPAAVPTSLPVQFRSVGSEVRCSNCSKRHGEELTGSLRWTCPRCKAENLSTSGDGSIQERSELAPLITALITREPQQPIIFPPGPDMSMVADAILQVRDFMVQERAEREPPQVHVTLPAMTVNPEIHVNIPPGEPPVVNVTMPEIAPADVTVGATTVHLPEPIRTRRRVERDDRGLITFVTDEPIREDAG